MGWRMGVGRRLVLVVACSALLLPVSGFADATAGSPPLPPEVVPSTNPFTGCIPYPDGLTRCSAEIPSFDQTKLDVTLTLPARSGARHPLIVMLHGFGNNKHEWQSLTDEGDGADKWHWNDHWMAEHGYYTLTYTARGFNDPGPGPAYEPQTPGGTSASPSDYYGTIHLKSKEWEIRDTQWLAGLAALFYSDLDRSSVAVTGGSYGGGESWLQASQAAGYTSSDGKPAWGSFPELPALQLQVAVPKYPWTDLAYSLAPNGHGGGPSMNDIYESAQGQPDSFEVDQNPFGVPKLSYVGGFFALGNGSGRFPVAEDTPYSREEQEDGPISLADWFVRASADPYFKDDLIVRQIRRGLTRYRGSYYQTDGWAAEKATNHEVAVMSISGWTDDLFPPVESFRQFKYLKRLDDRWPVSVVTADVGHPRAQNKPETWHRLNNRAWEFLQSNINGTHERQTHVYSEATICPNAADNGQNLKAAQQLEGRTPEELANGTLTVRYAGDAKLTNGSGAGDPDGLATDPVLGSQILPTPGCRASHTDSWPDRYSGVSAPADKPRIYVGLGEVDVEFEHTGVTGQLDARLWDVSPDGKTELLVSRGTYRFDPDRPELAGKLRLPLFGNQWTIEQGHALRLDLSEVDTPFLLQDTTFNSLHIHGISLVLPTREATNLSLTGVQTSPA